MHQSNIAILLIYGTKKPVPHNFAYIHTPTVYIYSWITVFFVFTVIWIMHSRSQSAKKKNDSIAINLMRYLSLTVHAHEWIIMNEWSGGWKKYHITAFLGWPTSTRTHMLSVSIILGYKCNFSAICCCYVLCCLWLQYMCSHVPIPCSTEHHTMPISPLSGKTALFIYLFIYYITCIGVSSHCHVFMVNFWNHN